VEIFEAFERATSFTAGIAKGVRSDQLGAPTPCTEWDVSALLNHIVGTLWLADGLLADRTPRHAMQPGGLPATDLLGGEPATAYAEASVAALATAGTGDALTRTHATPFGDMPGAMLAGFTTVDIAVHGWDLGTATGQDVELDADLAGHLLTFAEQTLTDDSRGSRIGPAIPVSADAPITDRLVAFFGRRP
jgi:uncharacterized protein (TIGR03086 family)